MEFVDEQKIGAEVKGQLDGFCFVLIQMGQVRTWMEGSPNFEPGWTICHPLPHGVRGGGVCEFPLDHPRNQNVMEDLLDEICSAHRDQVP